MERTALEAPPGLCDKGQFRRNFICLIRSLFVPEKLAGFKLRIRSFCTALTARRATYSCRWLKPPVWGNHQYLSPEGDTSCMIRCVALRAFHRTATKPVAYATGKGCVALRAISLSVPCCGTKVASTESFRIGFGRTAQAPPRLSNAFTTPLAGATVASSSGARGRVHKNRRELPFSNTFARGSV